MPNTVMLKGNKLHLLGSLPKEGDAAPDCELMGPDLKPIRLSSFKGKVTVVIAVPSIDTPTCSTEARRFNQELDKFGDKIHSLCISMDLPFAQSRWCAAEGVKHLRFLSDFKNHDFGEKFGVLIQEIGLLARAVFLINQEMKIAGVFLVPEVSEEPDYTKVLEHLKKIVS